MFIFFFMLSDVCCSERKELSSKGTRNIYTIRPRKPLTYKKYACTWNMFERGIGKWYNLITTTCVVNKKTARFIIIFLKNFFFYLYFLTECLHIVFIPAVRPAHCLYDYFGRI